MHNHMFATIEMTCSELMDSLKPRAGHNTVGRQESLFRRLWYITNLWDFPIMFK